MKEELKYALNGVKELDKHFTSNGQLIQTMIESISAYTYKNESMDLMKSVKVSIENETVISELAFMALLYNYRKFSYEKMDDFLYSRLNWIEEAPMTLDDAYCELVKDLMDIIKNPKNNFRLKPIAAVLSMVVNKE